ncbi:oxidoreductase [Rhodovibrio salinarum]|uniref:Oxidoreductase n=2 Tax=Rhodovibrio salinarum TaxID=1087 RepID=A0A934QG20_9PROT|nr:oxidoreductase [Rhodovibrio salinarum]
MDSHAQSLGTPEGKVVLTVTGEIGRTNRDDAMVFDRAMLRELPQTSFTTSTIWTKGKHSFTGVALRDLLSAVEAKGKTLRATALNDYAIVMPIDAAEGALVAYAMDGEAMSVRDKGPLWIVYPFDSDAAFQRETVYARSIWQLNRLQVTD